jgi:1-acyl-sn-glycerol-3-phosphate acyltransferase
MEKETFLFRYIFFTIYGYLLFLIISIIMFISFLPAALFLKILNIDNEKKIFSYLTKFYCYSFFTLYLVHKLNVDKKEFVPQEKGAKRIYVLNHSSMYDSILLYVIPGAVKTILNEKWGKTFLGLMQSFSGNIVLKNNAGISDSFSRIENIKNKLEKGIPLVIFPEGTRSKTGKIGKFYSGTFSLALDTKADIVPVVMDSWNSIRPDGLWIRDPKPRIKFLKTIKYENYNNLSAVELSKNIRIEMIESLVNLRNKRRIEENNYYRKMEKYCEIDKEMEKECIFLRNKNIQLKSQGGQTEK